MDASCQSKTTLKGHFSTSAQFACLYHESFLSCLLTFRVFERILTDLERRVAQVGFIFPANDGAVIVDIATVAELMNMSAQARRTAGKGRAQG
jgi:hypothetical protein